MQPLAGSGLLIPPSRTLVRAVIVLFLTWEPGAPKITIPPSVVSVTVFPATSLLPHASEIPSAQAPVPA